MDGMYKGMVVGEMIAAQVTLKKLEQLFVDERWDMVLRMSDAAIATAEKLRVVINNVVCASRMYSMLAAAHRELGNIHKAIELYEESKSVLDSLEGTTEKSQAYGNTAVCYAEVGRYEEALSLYKKSFGWCDSESDKHKVMYCIGNCQNKMGNHTKAFQCYQKAFAMAKKRDDLVEQIVCMQNMARCRLLMADYDTAYSLYEDSSALLPDFFRQNGIPIKIRTTNSIGMGVVRWAQAREAGMEGSQSIDRSQHWLRTDALVHLESALAECSEAPTVSGYIVRDVLMYMAFVFADDGRDTDALQALRRMLDVYMTDARVCCWTCAQARGPHVPMLRCGRCKVARFCNAECQSMASSKEGSKNGDHIVRHRELCPLLDEWREMGLGRTTVDSCLELQTAFLHGPDYGPGAWPRPPHT